MTLATSDENTLQAAAALLGPEPVPARRRTLPGPQWWPWAAAVVLVVLVAGVVGRATAADPVAEGPRTAARSLEAGSPLGGIGGTSSRDVPAAPAANKADHRDAATRWVAATGADRQAVAWPGQVLTAPDPGVGRAVAWQWQTCDPSDELLNDQDEDGTQRDELALDCKAVGGATDDTWTSPPTPRTRLVRVVVTVNLGNDVLVRAASDPITAMAWPDGVAPGEAIDN